MPNKRIRLKKYWYDKLMQPLGCYSCDGTGFYVHNGLDFDNLDQNGIPKFNESLYGTIERCGDCGGTGLSHYQWLEQNLPNFFKNLGLDFNLYKGIIVAHGDKCYGFKDHFQKANIPFVHGVALYLLCYIEPYASESRQTKDGWVPVEKWIIENYARFLNHLPKI